MTVVIESSNFGFLWDGDDGGAFEAWGDFAQLQWSVQKMGIFWRFSTAWYGMVRYGTVHFWGVFHWVLYLVPDTFLVPLRSRFHASRYRYQNVTCKLCWSLNGRRKSALLRHWTCDTRPSSTALPARFKSAQPAKDRTQLLFKQTHIFASTTK